MSHSAPTAPTLREPSGTYIQELRYIREQVLPRYDERNIWQKDDVFSFGKLLARSTRPLKVTTKRINYSNILLYQSGKLVGGFDRTLTSLASHQARRACTSRYSQRSYLRASELPIPEGKIFPAEQAQNALEYQQQLGAPTTVRPISGKTQHGFSSGISTDDQLTDAWEVAAEACSTLPATQRQILVEQHHSGLDLRMYVVGEEVVGVVVRLPFYVVGDGESNLAELHERLVTALETDAYLKPPTLDDVQSLLARWDSSPNHTPGNGEVVPLSETAGAAPSRAITVDATHDVAPELKQLAIDAMWAFPGLSASGVDLRVRGIDDPAEAMITDVDPAADFKEFRYPTYGKYRRVSLNIIRHMVQQSNG